MSAMLRQARLLQRPEDHASVEIERVGGGQDHAERGQECDPGVGLERAHQREELADEAARARQPDVGQREHHEDGGVERHTVDEPAVGRDLAGVHAVVDDAHAQEQRRRHQPVRQHLEDGAVHPLHGEAEMPMVTKPCGRRWNRRSAFDALSIVAIIYTSLVALARRTSRS